MHRPLRASWGGNNNTHISAHSVITRVHSDPHTTPGKAPPLQIISIEWPVAMDTCPIGGSHKAETSWCLHCLSSAGGCGALVSPFHTVHPCRGFMRVWAQTYYCSKRTVSCGGWIVSLSLPHTNSLAAGEKGSEVAGGVFVLSATGLQWIH